MVKKWRNVIFIEKLFFWENKKVLPTKKSVGGTFLSLYRKKKFLGKNASTSFSVFFKYFFTFSEKLYFWT